MKLTILTLSGARTDIEITPDVVVDDFVRDLCVTLDLPLMDAKGHKADWKLQDTRTGQILNSTKSLVTVGVKEGDHLLLLQPAAAGGVAFTADTPFAPPQEINSVTKLLWWCSGAQATILRNLPTEYSKYQGLGIAVLVDGLLAAISGAYAFYIAFSSQFFGTLFGFLWGVIVFNLTRFTLASIRTPADEELGALPSFLSRMFSALPRLLLAALIGFVLSTPIMLRMFRNDIYEQIQSNNRVQKAQVVRDIAKYEATIAIMQRRTTEKEQEVERLRHLLLDEQQGTGPSTTSGQGPFYRQLLSELNIAQRELQEARSQTLDALNQDSLRLSDLKAEGKILDAEVERVPGLASQLQVLSDLAKSNPAIATAQWLMTLLLTLIYVSPLLLKLLSASGPYDVLVSRQELRSVEKESLAIQNVFTELLDRSDLNPRNKEALWKDAPR